MKGLTRSRRITIAFCDRFCVFEWAYIASSLQKEVEKFVEDILGLVLRWRLRRV
jgi:hypothetical protein